ncbi:unnamed protein product, partial [Phaeothamnion confervicola]
GGGEQPVNLPRTHASRARLATALRGPSGGGGDGSGAAPAARLPPQASEAWLASEWEALSTAAGHDEWSGALLAAGAMRGLAAALERCMDADAAFALLGPAGRQWSLRPTDEQEGGGVDPAGAGAGGNVGAGANAGDAEMLATTLLAVQVEALVAEGALICAHPQAGREAFHRADGPLLLQRVVGAAIVQQWAQALTDQPALALPLPPPPRPSELPGAPPPSDFSSSARVALALHRSAVALRTTELCLRVGPPGIVDRTGVDVVEEAAVVLAALPPTFELVAAAAASAASAAAAARGGASNAFGGGGAAAAAAARPDSSESSGGAASGKRQAQSASPATSSHSESSWRSQRAKGRASRGGGALAEVSILDDVVAAPKLRHDLWPWEQERTRRSMGASAATGVAAGTATMKFGDDSGDRGPPLCELLGNWADRSADGTGAKPGGGAATAAAGSRSSTGGGG